jgi:PAT family beta-lactamase induction signal transducer AmpG
MASSILNVRNSASWRLLAVTLLGFASGLPLALTGTALQAWLTIDGIDIATIGFFSLVGLPYTFKFLWAPLMDRFEPPLLGRRRGWLVLSQLSIAGALVLLSTISPQQNTQLFSLVAVLIAFLSASQDVVIDAYRTDVLAPVERGIGSSLNVFGYRLAMIISGGVAFVWADPQSGNGWSWSQIYLIMAALMVGAAAASLFLIPSIPKAEAPKTAARNDIFGFLSVAAAVFVGYQFTVHAASPISHSLLSPLFPASETGATHPDLKKWADLVSLLMGMAMTIPLAWFASQKARFETLNVSLANYFSMKGAMAFLAFIILYKLGDAFTGVLMTSFLLKGVGFAQAEVGVVNKVIGIWLTIIGALLGGALMVKFRLYKSLLIFGVLQMISNLGFWLVAYLGKDAWGGFSLPAFDIWIVSLKEAAHVDWLLLFTVATENLTGGMGTAAFVAFLMSLCNQKFTATQYALLSAFSAVGRVWVGPLAGILATSIGWTTFFIFSTVMAVPGLVMLIKLRNEIRVLEAPKGSLLADD